MSCTPTAPLAPSCPGRASTDPKRASIEPLRALNVARRSAVKAQQASWRQIQALLVNAPADLRDRYRDPPDAKLVATLANTRAEKLTSPDLTDVMYALRCLARRHRTLDEEITGLEERLQARAIKANPALMSIKGVGPGHRCPTVDHRRGQPRPAPHASLVGGPHLWAVAALGVGPHPGPARSWWGTSVSAPEAGTVPQLHGHPGAAPSRRSHRDVPTPSRSSSRLCWPTMTAPDTGRSRPTCTCPRTPCGPGCVGSPLEPSGCASRRPCGPTSATPCCPRSPRPGPCSVTPWWGWASRPAPTDADWASTPRRSRS